VSEFYVEVNEITLFVRRNENVSASPTIIFLHDSLGCVQLWRDFPERLAGLAECNFVIYDRQGYGKSMALNSHHRENNYLHTEAKVLNDLITKLQLEDAILFGHSDGGSIALLAAAKYPARINSVIVEAAHVFVEDTTLNGIRAAVATFATSNLRSRLEKYHGDKTTTIFNAWTETWLRDDFRKWNIENVLPDIQCPCLFIQGDQDEYGTVRQMKAVADLVNGPVDTFLIPGVNHTPHKMANREVIMRSVEFIRSSRPH
jgi:pimeloyl-ACP methyl ester carboxylesterase